MHFVLHRKRQGFYRHTNSQTGAQVLEAVPWPAPSIQKSDIKSQVETDEEAIHTFWENRRWNSNSANQLHCDEGRQAGKVGM